MQLLGKLLSGFFLVASLVPSGVQAQTSRGQAYAVQCIGFAGGRTTASVGAYIYMASTNAKYYFGAECDSAVNGGQAVITGPDIPASAGPVTNIMLLTTLTRLGTPYRQTVHSVQTSTGFLSASLLADPASGTGEVHLLISVVP